VDRAASSENRTLDPVLPAHVGLADRSGKPRAGGSSDLEAFFERIEREDPRRYAHDDEGPDDMPAHILAALIGVTLSVPLVVGRLSLGTWQGLYLFEHRLAPHRREIAAHAIGE
jgi:secondary thiamine-phosphate synthase enzyme